MMMMMMIIIIIIIIIATVWNGAASSYINGFQCSSINSWGYYTTTLSSATNICLTMPDCWGVTYQGGNLNNSITGSFTGSFAFCNNMNSWNVIQDPTYTNSITLSPKRYIGTSNGNNNIRQQQQHDACIHAQS
jgi:hypothetical protein